MAQHSNNRHSTQGVLPATPIWIYPFTMDCGGRAEKHGKTLQDEEVPLRRAAAGRVLWLQEWHGAEAGGGAGEARQHERGDGGGGTKGGAVDGGPLVRAARLWQHRPQRRRERASGHDR